MKSILIPAALAVALAAFRELNVRPRRELSMVDIARQINPLLRSWIEYYGRYALSQGVESRSDTAIRRFALA
jgi:hypothetical protein